MNHSSDDSDFRDNLKKNFRQYDGKNRKLLPDGFGFTEDTYKFRLPEFQPEWILDPRRVLFSKPLRKSDIGKGQKSGNKVNEGNDMNGKGFHNQTYTEQDGHKHRTLPDTDGGSINSQTDSSTSVDLEEDRLRVTGIIRKTLPNGSDVAPDDFVYYNELKQKKPIGENKVHIPHIFGGKLENDEFGATLRTCKAKEHDGLTYYRHYLVNIKDDGPAKQMGIEKDDEIVLLLGVFVPDLEHKIVLKQFHKVKVDGKTRFYLVIRRWRARWMWMEISAILAPEKPTEEYPVVEKPEIKALKDNCHEYSYTQMFYKVPGTQFYLQINNGLVSVDTMNKVTDTTKIIWRRVFVCQADDTGEFKFEASLSDGSRELYITIDKMKNIVLNSEPQLFQMFSIGDKVRFRANKMYLGYNRNTKQVLADVCNCDFQEFPAENGESVDETDGSWTQNSSDMMEYQSSDMMEYQTSDMMEYQTCGKTKEKDNIQLKVTNVEYTSQQSTDSGADSLLSTQASCESNGGLLLRQISRDSGTYSLSPRISTDNISPVITSDGNDLETNRELSDRVSERLCTRYRPSQRLGV